MGQHPKVHLSVFSNVKTNKPVLSQEFTWEEVIKSLATPKIVPEKSQAPLVSLVRFNGTRSKANVELGTAIVMDIDTGVSFDSIKDKIKHSEYFAYSTHSNSVETPKYRIIFPLATAVSDADQYNTMWRVVNTMIGNIADEHAQDAARVSYWHSYPAEKADIAFTYHNVGEWLAPHKLDIIKNWDTLKPKDEEIDFKKGYPDGERTHALVQRCGLLLGPKYNCTPEQALEILVRWNVFNSPPLPEEKIRTTLFSIARREINKQLTNGNRLQNFDSDKLPELPAGYKWNSKSQITTEVPVKDEDGSENLELVVITEYPIYLLSVTRKERESAQAYMFRIKLPLEEWREFKINCNDFEGKNWKTHLYQHTGHCVLNDKLFINYVHNADIMLRRTQMDAVRYQQFGWKEDNSSFLIGDTLIYNGGKVETVYGGEEISHRMKQMAPRKGGSLNEWSKDANLLFSDQYIHLGYALVASFATPLLKFCMGESDGGFVLSITSPGSGKGKTRTIEACTSVWGELESLQITPRDTLNAQMAIVTSASNLPVFMDEWNEKDPEIQARFLRQLTVGHDKNRAQRDGTVKSKPASYKTLLITTSNHSIQDIMNMINDEAAAARVVELVAPDMDGEVFKKFDALTSRMLKNSGYAGREFIFQIMQPGVLDQIKLDLAIAVDRIREHLHTEGKHRYLTVLPAAIFITASLLVKHGILEFDVARLIKWSFEHVRNRVQTKVVIPPAEILSLFLSENVGKVLSVSGPYLGKTPVMVLNNNGNLPSNIIARAERDTNRLFLVPSYFRMWCTKNNHDYENIAKALEVGDILLDRRRTISLGAGTTAKLGRSTCWELNMGMEGIGGDAISSESPDHQ